MIDIELQTPGLRETAALLREKVADAGDVGRIADEDHDSQMDHGGFLRSKPLAYQQFG